MGNLLLSFFENMTCHGAPTAWHTLGAILFGCFRVLFCVSKTRYDLFNEKYDFPLENILVQKT